MEFTTNIPTPGPTWYSHGNNQQFDSSLLNMVALIASIIGICGIVKCVECVGSYNRRQTVDPYNVSDLSIADIESSEEIEYKPDSFVHPPPYTEIITIHPESPEATEVNALSDQMGITRG